MKRYEIKAQKELIEWKKKKMRKKPNIMNRVSKNVQSKINSWIPEKVHHVITESMKKMIQGTLVGSEYTTKKKGVSFYSLEEKENLVREKISFYKKAAALEGAGTGAAGFFVGLADFPLLLGIKMKLLFEIATIYGFNIGRYEERLYIPYLFQLAFSSEQRRIETLLLLENWEVRKKELMELDWRVFQQEYRDYIDLVKLLQLVPGIGAAVGAYANYYLLESALEKWP